MKIRCLAATVSVAALALSGCSMIGGSSRATAPVTTAVASSAAPSASTDVSSAKPSAPATSAQPTSAKPTTQATQASNTKATPFAHGLTINLTPNWTIDKPLTTIKGTKVQHIVFRDKATDSLTIFYVTPVMESSAAAVCGTLNRGLMKELTGVKEHGPQTLVLGPGVDGIMCGATGTNPKGQKNDYIYSVAQKKSSADPKSGLLVWQYSRFALKGGSAQGKQAGESFVDLARQVGQKVK